MPNMVIPDAGQLLWLTWALIDSGETLESYTLHLYSNDYTPVQDTVTESFTEATFPGYSAIDYARDDFGAPATVDDIAVSTLSPTPTWTCTGGGGQLIYGWYLVGATSGTCLAAQQFAAPRNMTTGSTETLDPFTISLMGIGEA
jgi:hypothetical protein